MNNNNFEHILPANYREVYRLDATKAKIGILFNLAALLIMAVVFFLGCLPIWFHESFQWKAFLPFVLPATLLGIILMFIYLVLHELVHGLAYRLLTGQPLTFGFRWSCAFCGVPNIYTYRKAAIIAVVLPFAVFSVLMLALMAVFYFVSFFWYLVTLFLFSVHFGGCIGDLYALFLFLFKFRDRRLLMRDTGPEQTFYLPENTL